MTSDVGDTRSGRGRGTETLSAWLAGLVVGAFVGLLFGVWPTIGALLFALFTVPALASRNRVGAISGLLVGLPAAWLSLVTVASANCSAFDAAPNQSCGAPDLTAWVVLAVALLVGGLAGSFALGIRRRD